jgi:hypothetical protein
MCGFEVSERLRWAAVLGSFEQASAALYFFVFRLCFIDVLTDRLSLQTLGKARNLLER